MKYKENVSKYLETLTSGSENIYENVFLSSIIIRGDVKIQGTATATICNSLQLAIIFINDSSSTWFKRLI